MKSSPNVHNYRDCMSEIKGSDICLCEKGIQNVRSYYKIRKKKSELNAYIYYFSRRWTVWEEDSLKEDMELVIERKQWKVTAIDLLWALSGCRSSFLHKHTIHKSHIKNIRELLDN